ncbi:putative porin [Fibrobacterota bacterium]
MKLKKALITFIILTLGATQVIAEQESNPLKATGSLRYRHELFLEEDSDSRNRHRFQAKLGIAAEVNPSARVGLELASGGRTARSANQSLDGGFSKKAFMINQAYFAWSPKAVAGMTLQGGKFKGPFAKVSKTELVWDGDFVPEGILLKYDREYPSKVHAFMNIAGLWVEEHGGDTDDLLMFAGQGGAKMPVGAMSIKAAAGVYHYLNGQGHGPLTDGFHGNSTMPVVDGPDTSLGYAEDFTPVEAMLELTMKPGGVPLALFGHYVQNVMADNNNMGWLAGIAVGKAKKPGTIDFRAYYRVLEQDAVFDVYADSDFGGGGTDNSGVELNMGIGIAKNTKGKISYFINQAGIDNGTSYQRGQFDVKFSF